MTTGNWTADTRAGIAWSGASFFAGKGLTFLATVVLARLLSPAEFGVVAAIVVYLLVIELASDLGMQATVVYEQEEGVSERVQTAFTINLVLVVLLTGLAVLLAPVAADFFDVEGETDLFRLGALNLLVIGLGNIPDGLLLRDMQFRRRAGPLLVRAAVSGTVSIALAVGGLGAEALVFGLLAGSAAWTVVLWTMTPLRPRLSFDRDIARSMAGYGVGATMLDGLAAVGGRMDQAIIGPVLGPRALGLYTVGSRLPEVLISNMSSVVSHVGFSALARQRMDDARRLAEATLGLVRYQTLYAMPVAVGLAVLASPIITVLFSSTWTAAGGVMAAMAVKTGIAASVWPVGDALKAVGRQRTLVAFSLVKLPLIVGLMIAVAPEGIVLVAWVRALSELVHVGFVTWLASRAIALRPGALIPALTPALIACAGVAAGTGAVRLVWDDLTVLPLLTGVAAGVAGGYVALRVFAPEQVRTLLGHLREIAPRRRARAGAKG